MSWVDSVWRLGRIWCEGGVQVCDTEETQPIKILVPSETLRMVQNSPIGSEILRLERFKHPKLAILAASSLPRCGSVRARD